MNVHAHNLHRLWCLGPLVVFGASLVPFHHKLKATSEHEKRMEAFNVSMGHVPIRAMPPDVTFAIDARGFRDLRRSQHQSSLYDAFGICDG